MRFVPAIVAMSTVCRGLPFYVLLAYLYCLDLGPPWPPLAVVRIRVTVQGQAFTRPQHNFSTISDSGIFFELNPAHW